MITVVAPPIAGGVSDYAMAIADATSSRLLSFDSVFDEATCEDILFIQVSHYGYQKRGAPLGLLRWTRKQKQRGSKIGCYFHELFAFGPLWTSSFWLSPVQRFITAEMARLSDFWMTNRQASARWLLQVGGRKPNEVLPVFSNVGEPKRHTSARTRELVVFGAAELRERTYREAGAGLFDWAVRQGLQVHDVGAALTDRKLRQELAARGTVEHGMLPKEEISRLLAQAMCGVIAYPVSYIAKSSVFAAYCAHGVPAFVISKGYAPTDGLFEGEQYWRWPTFEDRRLDESEAVGRQACEWYAGHAIQRHCEALQRFSR